MYNKKNEHIFKEYKQLLIKSERLIDRYQDFFHINDLPKYFHTAYGILNGEKVPQLTSEILNESGLTLFFLHWDGQYINYQTNNPNHQIARLQECDGIIKIKMSKYLKQFSDACIQILESQLEDIRRNHK